MALPVTVIIPIGPNPLYRVWMVDAVDSILQQTDLPGEIVIIDDAAHVTDHDIHNWFDKKSGEGIDWKWQSERTKFWVKQVDGHSNLGIKLWKAPWRLGFSAAFNCGVGLAYYDLILYLAVDDKLGPEAVADCIDAYEKNNRADAWYALSYQVGEEVRSIPINAAMITKGLWRFLGGFPPSAFAGPDALSLSCLMVHAPEKIIQVKPGKSNYWVRVHPDQDTNHNASFFLEEMNSIRNKETTRFIPNPEWAKDL